MTSESLPNVPAYYWLTDQTYLQTHSAGVCLIEQSDQQVCGQTPAETCVVGSDDSVDDALSGARCESSGACAGCWLV